MNRQLQKSKIILFLLFAFIIWLNNSNLFKDSLSIFSSLIFSASIVLISTFIIYSKFVLNKVFTIAILLFWLIMFSSEPENLNFSGSFLYTNLLIICVLEYLESSNLIVTPSDLGFLFCVSVILLPWNFVFILVIILHFLLSKMFIKNMVQFSLGCIVLAVVGIQLLYLYDIFQPINEYYTNLFNLEFLTPNTAVFILIPSFLVILFGIVDFYILNKNRNLGAKQEYFLIVLFFVLWVGTFVLFGNNDFKMLNYIGLPVALIVGRAVKFNKKKWIKNTIIIVFTLSLIFFYFENIYANLSI